MVGPSAPLDVHYVGGPLRPLAASVDQTEATEDMTAAAPGSQCARPGLRSDHLAHLGLEIDRLMNELSGTKQVEFPRARLQESFNRGVLTLISSWRASTRAISGPGSRNVFCSQVAIGRAGDGNALRGRLTMRMVFLATIECRGKSRKADGQWQKTRVTATRSRRMRRSRRRVDYRPTSSTSRNPPRPIDTLSRFLLAMHHYPRASPEPLLRLAS